MTDKNQVPLIEGLFTCHSDKPKLIASRCRKCGSLAFPKTAFCTNPDCVKDTSNVEMIQVSTKAKLHSWTVQVYPPAPPFKMEPFQPFPIGMVDFPEGLRVLGILTTDKVEIGMELEMTIKVLYEDEKNQYMTWALKPVA